MPSGHLHVFLGKMSIQIFCPFFLLFQPPHAVFLSQGSDSSCRCSNTGSLTHCAVPGIKSVSQGSSKAINPTEPQWELPAHFLHLILAKRLRSNPCPFFNQGFLGGEGGCWVVWAFCVFWVFTPYLDTSFTNIYTHSGGGLYLCCMKAFNFFVICLY